jgi:hypothetical protein
MSPWFWFRQFLHERGIGPSPMSDIAREVIRLLVADPYSWRRTPSYLVHNKSKIGIWTRNKAYGLHLILIPENEINGDNFHSEIQIELTSKEKRLIYKFANWNERDRKAALRSIASC